MVSRDSASHKAMFLRGFQSPHSTEPLMPDWIRPVHLLNNLMHFRCYGSDIARFLKPDNITGSPLNPQNWNLYSYVRGNPVNMNDPTGHEIVTTVIVAVTVSGLVVGAINLYILKLGESTVKLGPKAIDTTSALGQTDLLESGKQISGKWNQDKAKEAIWEGQEALDALKPAVGEVVPAAPGSQIGELLTDLIELTDKAVDSAAELLGIEKDDKEKKEEDTENKSEEMKKQDGKEDDAMLPQPPGSTMEQPPNKEVKK